ncbi:MAG: hypothetical protein AAF735_08660 [Myxococcota bacterium]
MTSQLKLIRVRYPTRYPAGPDIVEKYRQRVANVFSDASWHDIDRLPERPENALYFLYVSSGASESPQDFIAKFGRPPPEVCERIIVEVAFRGYIWRLMREFGFAAAWGIDYGVIGRLDVMRRCQPDYPRRGPTRDGKPVAPKYTRIMSNDGPAPIAAYFKALVEVLDEKPPPATPG